MGLVLIFLIIQTGRTQVSNSHDSKKKAKKYVNPIDVYTHMKMPFKLWTLCPLFQGNENLVSCWLYRAFAILSVSSIYIHLFYLKAYKENSGSCWNQIIKHFHKQIAVLDCTIFYYLAWVLYRASNWEIALKFLWVCILGTFPRAVSWLNLYLVLENL